MPAITAILHTHNDALRIARAIESLRPCDEVLVVDHGSEDDTCAVAVRFGAKVVSASETLPSNSGHAQKAKHDWILCVQPTESATEALEASLLEWKFQEHDENSTYSVLIQEETEHGWRECPAEVRLVHRGSARWQGWRPVAGPKMILLEGFLTRFRLP